MTGFPAQLVTSPQRRKVPKIWRSPNIGNLDASNFSLWIVTCVITCSLHPLPHNPQSSVRSMLFEITSVLQSNGMENKWSQEVSRVRLQNQLVNAAISPLPINTWQQHHEAMNADAASSHTVQHRRWSMQQSSLFVILLGPSKRTFVLVEHTFSIKPMLDMCVPCNPWSVPQVRPITTGCWQLPGLRQIPVMCKKSPKMLPIFWALHCQWFKPNAQQIPSC